MNTPKEQDELHKTEVVAGVNSKEEDPANTVAEEGTIPVHTDD